jgi:hypothetical protein
MHTSRFTSRMSLAIAALIIAGLLLGALATPSIAAEDHPGKARGHLYSTAAVNSYCQEAQKIIAGTSLESINVLNDSFDALVASDAAPYETPEGAVLPLTTQQLVTYGAYPDGQAFPQVISCKMKSAAALQYFYGPDAAVPGATCKTVVEQTLAAVFNSLTNKELRNLAFTPEQVLVDADLVANSGPNWLTPFPADVASLGADGLLHLQAKSLPVPRFLPPFLPVPPEKKGVHYCHLPSAEYLRALVTGEVQP